MNKQELLIFPTSRAIREYVNSQKEFNTLLPAHLTIDEFFKKSIIFENKKIIDEEEKILYLKEATKSVDLNALGISSNFIQFIKQSDYIYRFLLELASENIDINSIDEKDTYEFYKEHLKILKTIQKNYLAILDKNNAIDKINSLTHFKINENFIKRYSSVKIFFEGYFTGYEFELVKEISKNTSLSLEFVFNEYNKKSIEKFIDYGFDLEINHKYNIDLSTKKLISKVHYFKEDKDIQVKAFSSRINQIAFIKDCIAKSVKEGISPSKIALILPDESFVNTLSLFDKEKYFNYAMGTNIYTSKLYKVLDGIYSYLNEDEIKNIKNLEFLNLEKDEVDLIFKKNWNQNLTKELFLSITEFVISKESNPELKEKFDELVYKLNALLFSSDEYIKVKEAYKILHQKTSKLSLDDINSGKITVMGLLESRMINFDVTIICDFCENLIPKRSVKDKFLSSNIKKSVNLPTKFDRENLQKYYYDRLIYNSKKVFVSYVKNDSEQISRFASELFNQKIDEKVYDNYYKHILYDNLKLEHFKEEIVLDMDLSKQTWSASSLKEFLDCKRKYFLNHIIKIKEHDISLKPKGYELGNVVHETLEEFYKQDIFSYDKLLEIFNKFRSKNPFLNLNLEIWKRKLKDFISLEEKRFEEKIQVIGLEESFLIEYNGNKLRGTIDRIDKREDEYLVLDYKTSSSLKVNTKRTLENASDFQLEFYYLAVQELYKTSNISVYYYDLHNMKLLEEVVLEEKIKMLEEIFEGFKTEQVNFSKCEDKKTCLYCTYKTICDRV